MKLKKFKVKNYKVFKQEFSVDILNNTDSDGNFTILTGKNNMGKSTFLESINEFFKSPTKTLAIPSECFNDRSTDITLKAELFIDKFKDKQLWTLLEVAGCIAENIKEVQILNVTKTYKMDVAPKYVASINGTSISPAVVKNVVKLINEEEPYYIRPNMSTEEIDKLINTIYSDAISGSCESDNSSLEVVNTQIKTAIKSLKTETDELLRNVEKEVSKVLNNLSNNQDFNIKIEGSEPNNFSIKDLLKNTDTKITIDSASRKDMLLSEQGTGVQRMSLIYTIQNIINQKIGNLGDRMLLIDEPEAFLHPEAIRQLSASLYEIGNIMPIVITTHSPVLINLENDHTVIDIFKIDKNKSDAITLFTSQESNFDSDDIENMKILNYVDAYVNEFFFSDKNIIVEGFTEKLVLQYIQKEFNVPFHIINANGKATVRTIMKILNQFGTPYYVLHDVDNNPDHSERAIKAAKTNCLNIFSSKTEYSKIFVHDFTFEAVFYGNEVNKSVKTKEIFETLNSKEDKVCIKKDILETYNKIFDLGIEGLEGENINEKVIEITNENDIESLFEAIL